MWIVRALSRATSHRSRNEKPKATRLYVAKQTPPHATPSW